MSTIEIEISAHADKYIYVCVSRKYVAPSCATYCVGVVESTWHPPEGMCHVLCRRRGMHALGTA